MGDEFRLELWMKRAVSFTRAPAKPDCLRMRSQIHLGVYNDSEKHVAANEPVELSLSLEIIKMSTFESYADSQHCR